MADYTWPFSDSDARYLCEAFDEALEFNVELSVSRSGKVSTLSLPGARWRATMQFPDTGLSELVYRRQIEAFLLSLRGGADRLLMWNPLTPQPLGTMRGTVTLAAAVVAGASSAQITGGVSAPNLLRSPGFEVDSNADGVADGWTTYTSGAVSGAAWALASTLPAGERLQNQALSASSLGTTASDRLGISQASVPVTAGSTYALSAYAAWTAASTSGFALYVDWRTVGGGFISSSVTYTSNLVGNFATRYQMVAVAPALAAFADVYLFAHTRVSAAGVAGLRIDAAQFEMAPAPTLFVDPPTLLRGDRLSIAGQRVMLTADATASDAGAVTVQFQPALRAGAASGSAVTLVRPTTKYVIKSPVVQMAARGDRLPGFAVDLVEE